MAAAFRYIETPSSANVLKMIFEKFQSINSSEINLQDIVDISSAILLGQRLKVVPVGFEEDITKLAIDKSNESRPEDVRDILLQFSEIDIDQQLLQKLFMEYKSIFDKFSKHLSAVNCSKIEKLYQGIGMF